MEVANRDEGGVAFTIWLPEARDASGSLDPAASEKEREKGVTA